MCLPDLENLAFSILFFLPNYTSISIPYSIEKHSDYVIWASLSLMKTRRSLYQILRKSIPNGRHIYAHHVNVRPPGFCYVCFVIKLGLLETLMVFKEAVQLFMSFSASRTVLTDTTLSSNE